MKQEDINRQIAHILVLVTMNNVLYSKTIVDEISTLLAMVGIGKEKVEVE